MNDTLNDTGNVNFKGVNIFLYYYVWRSVLVTQ